MTQTHTLSDLAARFGGTLTGPDCAIQGVASLSSAQEGMLSFLADARYLSALHDSKATAVVTKPQWAGTSKHSQLICDDPRALFAKIANALFVTSVNDKQGVHPSVQVGENCDIDEHVRIDSGVVLGDACRIASGVWIQSGAVLGNQVVVGKDARIESNAVLMDRVLIGPDNLIHSGAIIGGEGFGFYQESGIFYAIKHHGSVRLGARVEVGCNTTIDRGFLDDTVLSDDVKIDNQVQVGHNVFIGSATAIAGCVALAGSCIIGRRCQIGGGSVIAGHVSLADGVIIMGGSEVGSSIKSAGVYGSGSMLQPAQSWKRNYVRQGQLDDMMKRIKALEQLKNE
jgi:UDP-3-O-[3-hydroxymyristoyl] glucosamine N-acyltransferase